MTANSFNIFAEDQAGIELATSKLDSAFLRRKSNSKYQLIDR